LLGNGSEKQIACKHLRPTRKPPRPVPGNTGRAKRFADVSDNAFYWYFVVAAWLPIYYLVYWFPIL
jgi:hypothetical protein